MYIYIYTFVARLSPSRRSLALLLGRLGNWRTIGSGLRLGTRGVLQSHLPSILLGMLRHSVARCGVEECGSR